MKVPKNTFVYYVIEGGRGVVIHLYIIDEKGQPHFFTADYNKKYWQYKSKEGWLSNFAPNEWHTYEALKAFDSRVDSIFKFSELF